MNSNASIALECVLRVMRPLARLLIRNGVSYPAFAQALKTVFLAAAKEELTARDMPQTDSAVSLLSGVHRRDVRTLTRLAPDPARDSQEPLSMVAQVIARWLSDPKFSDGQGRGLPLPRTGAENSFDQLVSEVSSDIRPRAVLDEMQRLGVATESPEDIRLASNAFIPRKAMQEMASIFANHLHDHLTAASLNLQGEADFLEQSVFVDEITEASANQLHKVSKQAWKQAFAAVMQEAQQRFDNDALHATAEEKTQRARFGVYFYSEKEDKS